MSIVPDSTHNIFTFKSWRLNEKSSEIIENNLYIIHCIWKKHKYKWNKLFPPNTLVFTEKGGNHKVFLAATSNMVDWNEMKSLNIWIYQLGMCTHSVNYFYYILPLRKRMAEGCKRKGMHKSMLCQLHVCCRK